MVNKKHSVNSVELLTGQYRAKLSSLYESGYTVKQLKKEFKMSGESISRALKDIYGEEHVRLVRYQRIAAKSSAYTGNRSHPKKDSAKKWYSVSPKPSWWTGTTISDYIYTHHLVYASTHNLTAIPKGYDVHHVDCNRMNNSPDNLQLMTHSDHMRLHLKLRRCNDYPTWEYTQVSGSAEHPTNEGEDIVCSMR